MSGSETIDTIAEGTVSGNQASIPASIREKADIKDGDKIRWYWNDGELSVEVIRRREGVFEGFEGFEGESETKDFDSVGIEPSGEKDAQRD
ncbi:MAG: AbrB/MazE/SpoVT family DNA-binding domain-containing protein [Halobacteria archaeon]|nr:AbrB/MazE/SpoVT family DNA-binding domain-containing protein [Halobacteria archaeon]